jgi:predicted ATPase
MSLRAVADRHAFASVTDAEDLVRLYVPSNELAGTRGDERPETKIYRALTQQGPPQRLHVYGDAGAGKTSLAELQAAYFLVDCDLRRVLEFADAAAQCAAGEDAERVAPRHVQRILDEHAPAASKVDFS